jgi:hypothetical protein
MAICAECSTRFEPDDFFQVCNLCGNQLLRQYEALQRFHGEVLTIAELAGRCVFKEHPERQVVWKVI